MKASSVPRMPHRGGHFSYTCICMYVSHLEPMGQALLQASAGGYLLAECTGEVAVRQVWRGPLHKFWTSRGGRFRLDAMWSSLLSP